MITYKRNINLKLLFKSKGLNNIETHLPDGAKYLYSAAVRLGLLDVIDSLKFGKDEFVLLPPMCPQGIVLPFQRKKVRCEFYHLTDDFKIEMSFLEKMILDSNCKVIFVIHYFGLLNSQIFEIKEICKKYNVVVIEDVVQGLFSKDNLGLPMGRVGDISIFSLPKFLPVPDGAIFVINNPDLKIKFTYHKSLFIPISILFHIFSLLINSFISKISNSFTYEIVKNISLLNYSAYYFFLYLNRSNHNISKITKRILTNIDYNHFVNQRVDLFNLYNSNLFNYHLEQLLPNLSGYPLTLKDSNIDDLKSSLKSIGLEPLSYVKGWDYIPQISGFEKEILLIYNHLLLPLDIKTPISVHENRILQLKKIFNL